MIKYLLMLSLLLTGCSDLPGVKCQTEHPSHFNQVLKLNAGFYKGCTFTHRSPNWVGDIDCEVHGWYSVPTSCTELYNDWKAEVVK